MKRKTLGEEFVAAIELQLKRLEQAPLLYAEVIPKVHRAPLPRFPYGLFELSGRVNRFAVNFQNHHASANTRHDSN